MNLDLSVQSVYESMTEGELEHMANKLNKNGYPSKGIHSAPDVYNRGYRAGLKDAKAKAVVQAKRNPDIGDMTMYQLVRELKKHDVTVERVLKEWYR